MTLTDYRDLIASKAALYGLDPDLVEAVVLTESSGHTDAFRHEPLFYQKYLRGKEPWVAWHPRRISSSYGLMQVMAPVAYELGLTGCPERLFQPEIGLEYGCKKLHREMQWADGNAAKALGAYNAGRGNWGGERALAYVEKVMANLRRVRAAA